MQTYKSLSMAIYILKPPTSLGFHQVWQENLQSGNEKPKDEN
jgi:hypothetical protein